MHIIKCDAHTFWLKIEKGEDQPNFFKTSLIIVCQEVSTSVEFPLLYLFEFYLFFMLPFTLCKFEKKAIIRNKEKIE